MHFCQSHLPLSSDMERGKSQSTVDTKLPPKYHKKMGLFDLPEFFEIIFYPRKVRQVLSQFFFATDLNHCVVSCFGIPYGM